MKNNVRELQPYGNILTNHIKPEKTLTTEEIVENEQIDKIVKSINEKLGFDKLPSDILISTMTLTCKIDTEFNCRNIARYIDLSYGGILSVKCGNENDTKTNRTLLPKKQKTGKKKKKRSVFYNQVSMYVMVKGKKKKPVSVKLFLNGSIQMTGCKTISHLTEALTKIFRELKKIKAIVISKNYSLKVVEKPFVTEMNNIKIQNVKNIKISMINSNFDINFKIDRSKLHNLMLAEKYEVSFDPEKHACVNVKYESSEKQLSIFVFEGGSIIITGVRNCFQIIEAYNFINKYLLINYNKIIKNDDLTNSNITMYLDREKLIENINNDFLNSSDDESDIDSYDEFDYDTNELSDYDNNTDVFNLKKEVETHNINKILKNNNKNDDVDESLKKIKKSKNMIYK